MSNTCARQILHPLSDRSRATHYQHAEDYLLLEREPWAEQRRADPPCGQWPELGGGPLLVRLFFVVRSASALLVGDRLTGKREIRVQEVTESVSFP